MIKPFLKNCVEGTFVQKPNNHLMRKTSLLLLLYLFFTSFAQAQNLSISGEIIEKENNPAAFATVTVLKPLDSSIVSGTASDIDGKFRLENLAPNKYILKIKYIGFEDYFTRVELSNAPVVLGKIALKSSITKLKTVDIVSNVVPVQQKGDTTQINADAYKVNKDANAEDLITKMPGITVQDGKVQAQGEEVKKVTVDGREFFGDDANAALKNLPAEVIDKIQVFDKKSEQSQFTGFDDGNSSKTINIVTKAQFRNGTFGKVFGGYGYEDRWKGGFSINSFKEKRRFTILGNTNNTNDQNFSSEDLLGVTASSGGGGNRGAGGGPRGGGRQGGQQNSAENFLVNQANGITTTHAFGMNYANQFKKVEFTGSYFFNYGDNTTLNNTFRQYISNESTGLTYDEAKKTQSTNINHRMNLKIEWKIDTMNSILFQPRASVQQNKGENTLFGINSLSTLELSDIINNSGSDLVGANISAPLLYRHSFKKRGRTFSVNVTPGYNTNQGNSNLDSYTLYLADTLQTNDTLNQIANKDLVGLTANSSINYTEPINDKAQLQFTYGNNFNKSISKKETFNFNTAENQYSSFDTLLSNDFNSLYASHSFGSSYQYREKKWDVSAGASYQYAQLSGEQDFPTQYKVNKTFNSILPNARFSYRFSNKRNLRAFYRSSNNAPSVSQLQNVVNNSNPLQLSTGNPDLKQDWQNSLTIRYSSSNTEKGTSFFAMVGGTYASDYIVNSTYIASKDTLLASDIFLPSGAQLSKPTNLNGYYNLRSFSNYGFPVKFLKSNLNLNAGGSYTKTPGMVNEQINYSYSGNAGFGFVLSSNISEKIDFTLSSNTTYNNIVNTLQPSLNSNYYNQNSKIKVQTLLFKALVIQTELNHQYNSGLSSAYNQNYMLWNAGMAYKFLKNKQAEVRLSVFDILKQNNSITRNTTETYFEDVQSNVLQQYFLLTFTYNIKHFKEKKKE